MNEGIIKPNENPGGQPGVISDSWEQIIASCNEGTYKDKYHIGDTKKLDLGSEGIVDMQIVAFDADELADGSGKAVVFNFIFVDRGQLAIAAEGYMRI